MATFLIGGLIALYAIYVIVHRVREMRKGKYCSCGCQDCQANCTIGKKEYK